jgi:hypothetical protein
MILSFSLSVSIDKYSKYLRKSDTTYIKPKGLPAIEDPKQYYSLKHYKKLSVYGYSIKKGELHFVCDKLDSVHIELIAKYSDIKSVADSISTNLELKAVLNISDKGYHKYKWKLDKGYLYIGTANTTDIQLLQIYTEIF